MNKILTILIGLILIIAPILVAGYYANWRSAAVEFLMGGVIIGVVLIGLLFILLGISELKN